MKKTVSTVAMATARPGRPRCGTPVSQPGRKAFSFRILAQRELYVVGEPLAIHVAMENRHSSAIHIKPFVLLPVDDPRNTIRFRIKEYQGKWLRRIVRTRMTELPVGPTEARLGRGQKFIQTFQIGGMYRRKADNTVAVEPLWSFGEDPAVGVLNNYPTQTPGKYEITAVYENRNGGTPSGSNKDAGVLAFWTGKLLSNTLLIQLVEKRGRR